MGNFPINQKNMYYNNVTIFPNIPKKILLLRMVKKKNLAKIGERFQTNYTY